MAENGTQSPTLAPTASPLTFCATATTVVPEFEPEMRAAHGALFVFSMVFIPGTLGWWLVRRKHYALRQRELALVSLTALAVFLNVATNSGVNWYGINTLPCDVHAWTSFWSVPLGAGPTVTRLAIFYSRHRYSQFLLLKNARDKLKNKGMSKSSRYLDTSNLTGLKAYARWMFKSSSESQLAPLLKTRDASRRNLIEVSDTHSETSTHSTWMYALRFMSKPLGLPAIVVGFYLVLGVVTSTIQYFPLDESPYGGKGCTSCRQDNIDYLIFSIALAITTIPGIYLMYKLRDVPDPLFIKYELQLTLGVGVLIVVGGAITLTAFPNFREFRAFDPLFAVNVVALLFHGLQTLYPIHLTYRFERESKSEGMQQALDSLKLKDWLSVPEGREAVARYLATEFSIENLFFYEQCEMYEKFYDQFNVSEVLELADDIIAAFVSDAGVMTVNLSSRQRNELLQRYKRLSRNSKPPRDLFERSMEAVYELMDRDSFYRFKSSEFASDREEIFVGKIELAPHELSPIRNGDT